MTKLLVPLTLVLALSGCGTLGSMFGPGQELAVPTTLSEAGQEAAKLINSSKVMLITSTNTVNQQASEGFLLRSEAIEARQWIKDRWAQVKTAEGFLGDGKDALAKGEAELIEKALAEFQRQLLAKAAARAAARKKGTT